MDATDAAYLRSIDALPLPTAAQCEHFVDSVIRIHSWYKKLPLREGGRFLFFVAPDAGAGYPEDQQRFQHGWKTTREYREKFGFLDYFWAVGEQGRFSRDAGDLIQLPDALGEVSLIQLYPFVSGARWADIALRELLRSSPATQQDLQREFDGHPYEAVVSQILRLQREHAGSGGELERRRDVLDAAALREREKIVSAVDRFLIWWQVRRASIS